MLCRVAYVLNIECKIQTYGDCYVVEFKLPVVMTRRQIRTEMWPTFCRVLPSAASRRPLYTMAGVLSFSRLRLQHERNCTHRLLNISHLDVLQAVRRYHIM